MVGEGKENINIKSKGGERERGSDAEKEERGVSTMTW